MHRWVPSPRARGRAALATAGLAVLAALGAGAAVAAFSGQTVTAASTFSATTLAPPSGLTASPSCVATSAVAFRDASSATGTGGSLTISKPAGVVSGDVMLAQFAVRANGSTITVPSGWSSIREENAAGAIQSVLYSKVAGASEPASYTWSSSVSARTGGGIVAYSGASTSSPINVHAGQTGSSATPIAPSVTTTLADTFLVTFFVARQQPLTSMPGEMNTRWNLATGGGAGSIGVGASDEARPAAGATGSRSAGTSSSFDWLGQSVALRPPASARASLSWTATPSTFATGYRLQRWLGSSQQNEQTVTPRAQTTATDSGLASSTTYTYKLFSFFGNWTSSQVTTSLTTSSC